MANAISDRLINNSKAAIYAAIEVHNKPIFPYRYEVCTILIINSWELILKAYITVNHPEIKLVDKNDFSKPFDECLNFVSSQQGNDFRTTHENLRLIYEYRCRIVHYYEERIDVLLFSLLSKNVILYYEFLLNRFQMDISTETNLHLMPIGFKRPISPIDFLSNESSIKESSLPVQSFVKSLISSIENLHRDGIEDSILLSYRMTVINENRIKNADIIAAITKNKTEGALSVENVLGKIQLSNDDGAKKIKIEEESLYDTIYTETYEDIVKTARASFSNFSKNSKFNSIMKKLKGDDRFHRFRFLNIKKKTGGGKDYYTKNVYEELNKHYQSI